MRNRKPKFDETITAKASFIKAAVTGRLPNSEFDFEFILYEQERRRRRLRGMTSRLHKDWTSLDNERRSAACRFEWARLQIFLATVVLPAFQQGNDDLYIVKLADPRWRFSPEELATSALFFPNREVHQGISNLREMKFNPTCMATYAVTGDLGERQTYSLQPRAHLLVSGASESAIRTVFRASLPHSSPEYYSRARVTHVPIFNAGHALACMTRLIAEDVEEYCVVDERARYWDPMLPKDELPWLRFMSTMPITGLVDFEGFSEPIKWRFAHEKMATLLGALAPALEKPGKG